MASTSDEHDDPIVIEIEDEFTRLPKEEQIRLTQEWLGSLRTDKPVELGVSGAELLREARGEMGW